MVGFLMFTDVGVEGVTLNELKVLWNSTLLVIKPM